MSPEITTGASTSVIIDSFSSIGIVKLSMYVISEGSRSAYSLLPSVKMS